MRPCRWQPTRLPRPWDSLGKNTGVGCHFLLQCMKVKNVKSLSRVRLLATPWTAAYQAPLAMGFSRQEYWSGVPLPSPLGTFKILSSICRTIQEARDPAGLFESCQSFGCILCFFMQTGHQKKKKNGSIPSKNILEKVSVCLC